MFPCKERCYCLFYLLPGFCRWVETNRKHLCGGKILLNPGNIRFRAIENSPHKSCVQRVPVTKLAFQWCFINSPGDWTEEGIVPSDTEKTSSHRARPPDLLAQDCLLLSLSSPAWFLSAPHAEASIWPGTVNAR